jgi:hypothetical protein
MHQAGLASAVGTKHEDALPDIKRHGERPAILLAYRKVNWHFRYPERK